MGESELTSYMNGLVDGEQRIRAFLNPSLRKRATQVGLYRDGAGPYCAALNDSDNCQRKCPHQSRQAVAVIHQTRTMEMMVVGGDREKKESRR